MSIAVRVAALYLLSTLLVLLALGGVLYLGIDRTLVDARYQDLHSDATDAATFVQRAVNREDDLRTLAPAIAVTLPHITNSTLTLRIFSANGTLLVALPPLGRGQTALPSRETIGLLPPGLLAATLAPAAGQDVIYAAAPIRGLTVAGGQGTIGVVEVGQSRADIDQVLHGVRNAFTLAAAAAGVLALAAGLLLARSVAQPIRRLETVATAIAGGDLDRRVTALPRDEIGALGASFNRMAGRLAGLLAEARGEQARLAALLASLTDGVLACDVTGTLTLENPAARELLNVARAAPVATLSEAAAALGIDTLWERAMGQDTGESRPGPVEREIQAGGRALLALAAPIPAGGAVCVLRDITRLRELEQGRTAVLRRLGHELRTPLTALRTVLANLSDAAAPAQAPALAMAEAEAARLSRLVEEILALAQGRTATTLEVRPLDLVALTRTTCTLFAGRAERRGVNLGGPDLGAPAVVVRADPDRLRQVLVNLLDNALRYTPPGGHVAVSVQETGHEARLEVRDNGEGMDAQTSRWAFEPYYQGNEALPADPANAAGPPAGHSGLGLAIVREIVGAHGGSVRLDSRPGAGTTVTVCLPLAAPVAPAEAPAPPA